MRILRGVTAALTVAGLVAVVGVLGVPGWVVPPAVVVGVVALAAAVVRTRRIVADAVLVGVAVVVLASTIVAAFVVPRSTTRDDAALRDRAQAAVAGYLTVPTGASSADAVAARLRALTPLLTDRALDDLRSQGPDAALPGAVATSGTQQAAVQSVGVAEVDGDSARVLVYAALRVTIPAVSPDPSVASIARWAVMRRVDGTWRLADLYPVGPGG
ncbi:MAG: hypothetical protein PGN29_19740 [Gordonia paraffinivorans]